VTRRAALEGAKAILVRRIAQLHEEIAGLEAEILSQTTQLELIRDEIGGVRELLEKGLERRPRLLALERAQAKIERDRAANRAEIARALTDRPAGAGLG
jgi:multidrug resistance efflux pump